MDETTRQALRRTLGAYATGVAVVSAARANGGLCGITVNSFASVSLDPPLVLWSLGEGSARYDVFAAATHWGVTVLGADEEKLARRMAKPESEGLQASEVDDLAGAPVLKAGLAHLACRTFEQRMMGDHLVIFGEVLGFRAAPGTALTFYRGRYGALADEG